MWFKRGPRKRQETTFSPESFTSISQGKLEQVRGSPVRHHPGSRITNNEQPPRALTHLSIGSLLPDREARAFTLTCKWKGNQLAIN